MGEPIDQLTFQFTIIALISLSNDLQTNFKGVIREHSRPAVVVVAVRVIINEVETQVLESSYCRLQPGHPFSLPTKSAEIGIFDIVRD